MDSYPPNISAAPPFPDVANVTTLVGLVPWRVRGRVISLTRIVGQPYDESETEGLYWSNGYTFTLIVPTTPPIVYALGKQTEIDFATGFYDKTFTISDADCTATSVIIPCLAIKSPSDGRSIDEIIWEQEIMSFAAKADTGSFVLYVKNRLAGLFFGKFIINYTIG